MLIVFFIKGYSHEYNLRHNRVGGGVSLFISNKITYSRRSDIQFNPLFNSIIIDILILFVWYVYYIGLLERFRV